MTLSTHTIGTSREGSSTHVKDGIFVEEVLITRAEDVSGTQLDWMSWTNDLAIHCELEGETDLPFTPTYYVGGDFKEEGGELRWGSAFLVGLFVKTITGRDFELTGHRRIPKAVLEDLVGRAFLKISYRARPKAGGEGKIRDWKQVAVRGDAESLQEARQRAADLFLEEFLRTGYPASYDREGALDRKAETRASQVWDEAKPAPEMDWIDPGDELPF